MPRIPMPTILCMTIFLSSTLLSAQIFAAGDSQAQSQGSPALECVEAPEVTGADDQWSPVSTCPAGFIGVGVAKLDLLGAHNRPTLHVNDLRCMDEGCKAYCIGSPCKLKARCCRIRL